MESFIRRNHIGCERFAAPVRRLPGARTTRSLLVYEHEQAHSARRQASTRIGSPPGSMTAAFSGLHEKHPRAERVITCGHKESQHWSCRGAFRQFRHNDSVGTRTCFGVAIRRRWEGLGAIDECASAARKQPKTSATTTQANRATGLSFMVWPYVWLLTSLANGSCACDRVVRDIHLRMKVTAGEPVHTG